VTNTQLFAKSNIIRHLKHDQPNDSKSNETSDADKSGPQTTEDKIKSSPSTEDNLKNNPTTENKLLTTQTRLDSILNTSSITDEYNPSNDETEHLTLELPDKLSQKMDNFQQGLDAREAENRAEQEKKEKAEKERAKVNEAVYSVENAINTGDAVEGATALRKRLSELPPELRAQALERLNESGALERLAVKTTDLNKQDTATAVKELSNSTSLVGPEHSRLITDPIANVMARGGMEQTGSAADGGGGLFPGANTHNSEREFIDGVAALGDSPEAELFRGSLTTSLDDIANNSQGETSDRANAMAGAVATGNSQLIPDDGVWTKARNLTSSVADKVSETVSHFDKVRSQATDNIIESTTQLSDMIAKLEPGDTLTISASGKVSARAEASFENSVTITKNEDGTYTVRGSAKILAGLGVKGAKNNDVSGWSAAAGAGGVVEFNFDNLQDAQKGARALVKFQTGLPLAYPSFEEQKLLLDNLSAVEFSVNGELNAKFSQITGGKIGKVESARLEFENGQISTLILNASLSGSISNESPFLKKLGLPESSNVGVQGTLSLAYNLDTQAEGNLNDQINAIREDPAKYIGNTETSVSATLKVTGSQTGDPVGAGFVATIKLEGANLTQIEAFTNRLSEGDIEGAIAAIGGTATVKVQTYTEAGVSFSKSIDVAKFSVSEVLRHIEQTTVYEIKPSDDGKGLKYVKSTD
jgi:hypothetical protein